MPQRCATATQYPPPASRTILTPCALLVHPRAQSRLNLKRLRLCLLIAMAFIVILLLGNGGLIAFVTAIYKDTYVKGDTTMSDANGKVVLTGKATHNLPLIVAPVLPDDELFSVETLRLTLPGSTSGPPELGSGEAINEVSPGVVTSLRISRVDKINSTAVVFHALGGEEIRVWNGVTTVRLSATGPEIPVCSADVTCAAFQVEGAELAEKYLAEAEALLEPFAEGRRRLADDCQDPLGSVGRDMAQTAADDRCNPVMIITTEAACRSHATKTGMVFGRVGNWGAPYHGCFYLQSQVLFGRGGSIAQMSKQMPPDYPYDRFRQNEDGVGNVDPSCLLLSNQAKLASMLKALLNVAQPACSDYGGDSSCPTEYGCEVKADWGYYCSGTWRLN